ncbi:MAG: putative diheme cytochrome c-553, partial [bacterium]|nr:putative diheme cytochrome c-553 [bacterium]
MRILVASLALVAAGCGDDTTSSGMDLAAAVGDMAVPDLASGASVARGEELVKHLLLCGSCHTTPDANGNPSTNAAAFLAGGRKFTLNLGGDAGSVDIYAPNLTPDDLSGLGTWSVSQIVDAVTVGVDDQGLPLWPTMPYPRFANLTPDDATSIALYLKSLPAQSRAVAQDTGHPTMASPALSYTSIPHTTLAAADPNFAAAERGRYLANLGCLTCHTPNGAAPLGLDVTKAYAGGRSFGGGLKSANLTPDATGLAGWTTADIIATLKTNQEKGTGVMLLAPMAGGPDGFGGLFDADLADLAAYVHTLPPVVNGPFG